MIALVLQSAPKKDFAIAKVREGAAGGQMPRLSKEFESVNKLLSHPQTWKKKSKPPWKAAMVPSAPAWSLRLSACCLWTARMFYLPFRKVLSYMNTSATVTVGRGREGDLRHFLHFCLSIPNGL